MESTLRNMLLIIKSVSGCNLSCKYCYMNAGSRPSITIMPEEILKKTIKEVAALQLDRIEFDWHGGEPLIAKSDFYKKAKELQLKYISTHTKVKNCLQSNGTLITDDWISFFIDYGFGVGVSIDGPEDIHNSNRCFKSGEGSYLSVIQGIKALQEKGIDVHVMPVVTEASAHKAKEIFDFFVGNGINHLAFTPCFQKSSGIGQLYEDFSKFIVRPESFGKFMVDIYDLWMEQNNPDISIRYLEQIIKMLLGGKSSLCIFRKGHFCHIFLTIDTNGDIYPCDSYMSEEFLLGNIKHDTLKEVLYSHKYNRFKENVVKVSNDCKCCPIFDICGGGCSFYRYVQSGDFRSKSYYCESTKMVVNHISKKLFSNLKGG